MSWARQDEDDPTWRSLSVRLPPLTTDTAHRQADSAVQLRGLQARDRGRMNSRSALSCAGRRRTAGVAADDHGANSLQHDEGRTRGSVGGRGIDGGSQLALDGSGRSQSYIGLCMAV